MSRRARRVRATVQLALPAAGRDQRT